MQLVQKNVFLEREKYLSYNLRILVLIHACVAIGFVTSMANDNSKYLGFLSSK
jgi:hypothetical protein